jgi:hypothetical protein
MERRAHFSKGVEGRINACRQRLRHHRATQRPRVVRPDAAQTGEDAASVKLPDSARMSSVAEILGEAARELGWLEKGIAQEVDEDTETRTGSSVKEEVGRA